MEYPYSDIDIVFVEKSLIFSQTMLLSPMNPQHRAEKAPITMMKVHMWSCLLICMYRTKPRFSSCRVYR